jgi:hypothetical protein
LSLIKLGKIIKKIIYIKVEDMPEGENPWLRENFAKRLYYKRAFESK